MKGYVRRVTQKAEKLSKEQLLSLLDAVADENEGLYSLLDSISAGLVIVNNDFVLLRKNTIADSRLPFSAHLDDIKAQSLPLWDCIEDDEISDFLRDCHAKGITNGSEDFSTVTSGGSVRFITITISPLMHNSKLCGKIILVNDITEKKNQDVLLHRMENLANLTNLAAGMAHEIKNPLGAISIHIQLLQKAVTKARENQDVMPPAKFIEGHIDVVNEEIEHLNKLVMDFLLAVRPVKASLELKDPDKMIRSLVDFIRPEFKKEGILVEFKPSESGKRIMADEKLFRDAVLNLAQNALAAIKTRASAAQDGFSGVFRIENSIRDSKFVIRISDNGCGMSDETVAKIFEPYYTTKANGTGLGMTMVYKITKEFAGEILVDSRENAGSVFTLEFPVPQKDVKLLPSEK